MKKLLFLLLAAPSFLLHAQNPVPNSGFENWTGSEPDLWSTSNVGSVFPIYQTSTSFAGSSAVKGEVVPVGPVDFYPFLGSSGTSGSGFPVSIMYSTLNFYYMTNLTGSDQLSAGVQINDAAHNIIGAGSTFYSGITPTFTLASIPIAYSASNPFEAQIFYTLSDSTGASATGDFFIIDEVSLSGTTGIPNPTDGASALEKVQPNPVNEGCYIYYSMSRAGSVRMDLIELSGRHIKQVCMHNETAGRHKVPMDAGAIPSGIYLLQMQAGGTTFTYPVSVIH